MDMEKNSNGLNHNNQQLHLKPNKILIYYINCIGLVCFGYYEPKLIKILIQFDLISMNCKLN